MPRPSKTVYKFNQKGKLIESYDSVTDAVNCEKIEYNYLYNRIAKSQDIEGFYYSYDENFKPPKRLKKKITIPTFFDIVAWSKIMRY